MRRRTPNGHRWLPLVLTAILPVAAVATDSLVWKAGPTGCPPRFAHTLVWDDIDHGFLVFGGEELNTGGFSIRDDLWLFDPGADSWTRIEPSTPAPHRAYHASVWDSKRHVLWTFGGAGPTLDTVNDLWCYHPVDRRWEAVAAVGAAPDARLGTHLEYWGANDRLVLMCGCTGFANPTVLRDVWTFNPATHTWSESATTGPARWEFSAALDPVHGVILVEGGMDQVGRATRSTWTFHVPSGTCSTLATDAPGLCSQCSVWDPIATRMLLYGGTDQSGAAASSQWWSCDGVRWSCMAQTAAPSGRAYSALARDPDNGSLCIFGGVQGDFGTPMVDGTPWIGHPAGGGKAHRASDPQRSSHP